MDLNKPVSAIMTTQLTTVSPSQRLVDIKHIFEKRDFHHHIPVVENNRLVGMISLQDYLYSIKGASLDDKDNVYNSTYARDIMREHPYSKTPATSIREIAAELAKGEVHAITIVEEGILKGIVSTADIIRFFIRTAN